MNPAGHRQPAGACNRSLRAEDAIRAGTWISFRRIVPIRSRRCPAPATAANARARLCVITATADRQDREHHRPLAADSTDVVGLKIATRAHQSLIWDRTRHLLRLRSSLLVFYPAALQALREAGIDLGETDCLELLSAAPDPGQARALSRSKIAAMLRRAGRREVEVKAEKIQAVLRAPALHQPDPIQRAYAAPVSAAVGMLVALRTLIGELGEVVGQGFGHHPAAEIYLSQPGLQLLSL